MKAETQATYLSKLVHDSKLYAEYELALPFIRIKRKSLKNMCIGDVLLLGLSNLDMILLSEDKISAKVSISEIGSGSKIKIIDTDVKPIYTYDSKKYEKIKLSFGLVQSKKIEHGHAIDISSLNLNETDIVSRQTIIAKGSLINVQGDIAIQIKEVFS